jgi:hypothetical protein
LSPGRRAAEPTKLAASIIPSKPCRRWFFILIIIETLYKVLIDSLGLCLFSQTLGFCLRFLALELGFFGRCLELVFDVGELGDFSVRHVA